MTAAIAATVCLAIAATFYLAACAFVIYAVFEYVQDMGDEWWG